MTAAVAVAPRPALLRTALALMTSTVASAGLGFAFWVVAARWFPAEEVGRISAAVSSLTLLAGIAQLNLTGMYGRFLPTAGARTRRLILTGYAASMGTSVLLTAGFLGLRLDAGVLGTGGWGRVLFGAGVLVSALFFIQDGVLTALRKASAVPVKNVISAGGKLLLLPVLPLVAGSGSLGLALLLAWVLPVTAVMIAVNTWIVTRLAAPSARSAPLAAGSPGLRSFVAAEYVNGLLNNAVAFLPPVLVTHALGAVGSAYFYIPWTIGTAVTTLVWNVAISFVVEATALPARALEHARRAIWLVAAVTVGGTLVLVTAAEPLLSVLGPDYAAHGAPALRLVGLSLPFSGILILYAAFAMMEKRMWTMVAVQATGAVFLLSGAAWGLTSGGFGIQAPALALLAGQAVVGLTLLPGLIRRYRALATTAPAWG